ncbi:GNAT family N-acetyltransferase [Secundilactobacillus collinoides]|uniref:N-acetyltransferase domain-containing protein n=1 Tax=Secundilactobacillus collinoides DSM 20515 = JCM 1123 TaxID=1423733 RepID=A0A0R2BQ39_SECCO|nr:GNAT family N-acetyltransferase [Secundilactobacillus collinoides]KRM77676.1 hypothetical protein FC82_GL003047 [Secundilactobacillus collinoides DSM 20515 = JCM 1123]
MTEITYRNLSSGPVTICRELCNQLMTYQANKTHLPKFKTILSSMNFENRLQPAFENSDEKALLVAFDGEQPIGYVFVNAEMLTQDKFNERPEWANQFSADSQWLFPNWLKLPTKIAELNNLYVDPTYQGQHIGGHLMAFAMDWLQHQSGAKDLFVFVSNGNNAGSLYERFGFRYDHEVLDGLIKAYYLENRGLD